MRTIDSLNSLEIFILEIVTKAEFGNLKYELVSSKPRTGCCRSKWSYWLTTLTRI